MKREFRIKGISWRFYNTFYVDIEPSEEMWLAYERKIDEYMEQNKDYVDEYNGCFLNISYSLDEDDDEFNLSSFFSEWAWEDIPYECSEEEKKAVFDFINEWKNKVPENPYGVNLECYDDTGYPNAISDEIPWKQEVLR